jgi:diguanylate cyclase (GGDEF)-like protein
VTLERVLQLYPSPAREKLSLEMERAATEGGGFDLTTPIRTPGGERRIVRTVGRARSGRGGRKLYGITQDVTKQLSAERRLWWAANHDPVTSLPNRLLFEDRIAVAAQRAQREKRSFALVIIEISDFARLTERSGYTVPDKHMMEVAARLGSVTRSSDTVARISINEFALILNDVNSRETLKPAMDRLTEQIRQMQKEEVGGDGILMSAGVAFFPEHATGPEELTRAAEMALAQAKRKLDHPIIVFDRQIADDVAKRRETILGRARESLARREFVPYYQPQIDIETNEVVGVEALVRWQTPDMLLDAKDFAYALDDHEIGSRVGRAVLDAVIADIARLRQITDRPFRVSINASRTEVLRNDFLDTFLEKTRNGNLKPNDFIIEITEDVIIGVDDQTLHDKISFLVSSGVEFSLDDFGTGYASLIHITSFPVKEIKIDKQFIFGIETDRRKRAIVKGIIQIARSMGLHVIAEGVETAEQQEVLREIGCRYAQGYLYSFPVPFAQFADMLERP